MDHNQLPEKHNIDKVTASKKIGGLDAKIPILPSFADEKFFYRHK